MFESHWFRRQKRTQIFFGQNNTKNGHCEKQSWVEVGVFVVYWAFLKVLRLKVAVTSSVGL